MFGPASGLLPQTSFLRPRTSNCTCSGCTEVLGPIEGLQSENRLHRLEITIAVNQRDLVFYRDRGDRTIRR